MNNTANNGDTKGLMEPTELLEYTLDATTYFLKSNDLAATYPSLGGHSAEDIAMDAVVKILESSVRPQTKTYVIEVVRNTCLDLIKQRKLEYEDTPDAEDIQLVPRGTIESTEDSLRESLDDDDLVLYDLWVIQGLTEESIATCYSVSPRTIRRRLTELKLTIQGFLKEPTEHT